MRGGIREAEGKLQISQIAKNANSWSDAAAPHVYNTPPSIPAYVHAACLLCLDLTVYVVRRSRGGSLQGSVLPALTSTNDDPLSG